MHRRAVAARAATPRRGAYEPRAAADASAAATETTDAQLRQQHKSDGIAREARQVEKRVDNGRRAVPTLGSAPTPRRDTHADVAVEKKINDRSDGRLSTPSRRRCEPSGHTAPLAGRSRRR